jgi:hypothetical protein
MKREEWEQNIRQACESVGTYKQSFDAMIKTLSCILETRDETFEAYDGTPIIEHTNSHGETNTAKNPALMLWNDLNTQALAYWRGLGLTPAGLKRIDEAAIKNEKKESALEKALKNLGGQELGNGKKIRNGD